MPPQVPPSSPFIHKLIVGTIATVAGIYTMLDAGKDFEYIKFEPHLPEEIERRKLDNSGLSIKYLDTRTLDYKPEAKERLRKLIEEQDLKDAEGKRDNLIESK